MKNQLFYNNNSLSHLTMQVKKHSRTIASQGGEGMGEGGWRKRGCQASNYSDWRHCHCQLFGLLLTNILKSADRPLIQTLKWNKIHPMPECYCLTFFKSVVVSKRHFYILSVMLLHVCFNMNGMEYFRKNHSSSFVVFDLSLGYVQ